MQRTELHACSGCRHAAGRNTTLTLLRDTSYCYVSLQFLGLYHTIVIRPSSSSSKTHSLAIILTAVLESETAVLRQDKAGLGLGLIPLVLFHNASCCPANRSAAVTQNSPKVNEELTGKWRMEEQSMRAVNANNSKLLGTKAKLELSPFLQIVGYFWRSVK